MASASGSAGSAIARSSNSSLSCRMRKRLRLTRPSPIEPDADGRAVTIHRNFSGESPSCRPRPLPPARPLPPRSRPRRAGVLLHPTALPGKFGVGDLGPVAVSFLDWAASAGLGLWQILPLGPPAFGDSPYGVASSFAGNPFLISPERLVENGLLAPSALDGAPTPSRPSESISKRSAGGSRSFSAPPSSGRAARGRCSNVWRPSAPPRASGSPTGPSTARSSASSRGAPGARGRAGCGSARTRRWRRPAASCATTSSSPSTSSSSSTISGERCAPRRASAASA